MSETDDSYGQPPGYGQGLQFGQAMAFGQPAPYGPPAPPGYADAAPLISGEPSPILVSFAEPERQSRVTILFRYLLAIPHLLVLSVFGVAGQIVAIIGWFAAIFSGQLPEWAHTILTGILRWQARVHGYVFLLTDTYPPFSLDDEPYPIRLASRPTKLSRLAVLFRFLLAIPAAIMVVIAGFGLAVLSFFVWLIALLAGGLPPAVHQAIAAVSRYTVRYAGFLFMITAEYPKGLYGDTRQVGDPGQGVPSAASPDSSAGPEPQGEQDLATGPDISTRAGTTVGVAPQLNEPVPVTDSAWRLSLSGASKGLVTACLIVGISAAVGYGIVIATVTRTASNNASSAVALTRLEAANHALTKGLQGLQPAIRACAGQLPCLKGVLLTQARELETFASNINAISVSGQAASEAATLVSVENAVVQDLNQLATAATNAHYLNIVRTTRLQQNLNNAAADYAKLVTDLGGTTH